MILQPQRVADYPNNDSIFLVWTFNDDVDIKPSFAQVCKLVDNLNHSLTIRVPNGNSSCVMAIGYEAWLRLELPEPLPKELRTFEEIKGAKYTAVSTPGDLHFHLRAESMDICFDMAMDISNLLKNVATCVNEVHGFRYWDGRSVIGFVDGTESPMNDERKFFAMVGDEDPSYKGGSYLFVQKYIHNMQTWRQMPVEQQEKVIGRYKMSDIEMTDAIKPSNSHSALTSIKDENGNDLKIIRDNVPFGNPSKNEIGTYFISYANTFSTTRKMLENMFIGDPPGNYDRLLDFSSPKTGSLFFAPTMNMLKDFSNQP